MLMLLSLLLLSLWSTILKLNYWLFAYENYGPKSWCVTITLWFVGINVMDLHLRTWRPRCADCPLCKNKMREKKPNVWKEKKRWPVKQWKLFFLFLATGWHEIRERETNGIQFLQTTSIREDLFLSLSVRRHWEKKEGLRVYQLRKSARESGYVVTWLFSRL